MVDIREIFIVIVHRQVHLVPFAFNATASNVPRRLSIRGLLTRQLKLNYKDKGGRITYSSLIIPKVGTLRRAAAIRQ